MKHLPEVFMLLTIAVVFIFVTALLGNMVANWSGMGRRNLLNCLRRFRKKFPRFVPRPGFPPCLLQKKYKKFGAEFRFAWYAFLLANSFIGYKLNEHAVTIENAVMALGMLLLSEFVLLFLLNRMRRSKYQKNFDACMQLYAAQGGMVGRLIDHNTQKDAIELPKSGRIVTLLITIDSQGSIRHPWCPAGHYELDLWIPGDMYHHIPWEIFSYRNPANAKEVSVFFSTFGSHPLAPEGVRFKLIGVEPRVLGSLLPFDLSLVRAALRRVDAEIEEMTLDQYAMRRAMREVNC